MFYLFVGWVFLYCVGPMFRLWMGLGQAQVPSLWSDTRSPTVIS